MPEIFKHNRSLAQKSRGAERRAVRKPNTTVHRSRRVYGAIADYVNASEVCYYVQSSLPNVHKDFSWIALHKRFEWSGCSFIFLLNPTERHHHKERVVDCRSSSAIVDATSIKFGQCEYDNGNQRDSRSHDNSIGWRLKAAIVTATENSPNWSARTSSERKTKKKMAKTRNVLSSLHSRSYIECIVSDRLKLLCVFLLVSNRFRERSISDRMAVKRIDHTAHRNETTIFTISANGSGLSILFSFFALSLQTNQFPINWHSQHTAGNYDGESQISISIVWMSPK